MNRSSERFLRSAFTPDTPNSHMHGFVGYESGAGPESRYGISWQACAFSMYGVIGFGACNKKVVAKQALNLRVSNYIHYIYIDIYIFHVIVSYPFKEVPMQVELTQKQKHLLDYLHREIRQSGKAPSLRQAGHVLGISHAAVAQGLRTLESKGYLRRERRYSRTIHLLNRVHGTAALHRWREVPIIGRVTAGLPMYAQQEWDGSVVVDTDRYHGRNLFALRIQGDSMTRAGILDGDLVICEPRQYAQNGEIVVALVGGEEATVKRFFLHADHIELRPENPRYTPLRCRFDEALIQGKVIGLQRGPEGIR